MGPQPRITTCEVLDHLRIPIAREQVPSQPSQHTVQLHFESCIASHLQALKTAVTSYPAVCMLAHETTNRCLCLRPDPDVCGLFFQHMQATQHPPHNAPHRPPRSGHPCTVSPPSRQVATQPPWFSSVTAPAKGAVPPILSTPMAGLRCLRCPGATGKPGTKGLVSYLPL